MGVFRNYPNILGTPIISGTGKATNFTFCTHFHNVNAIAKKPIKIFGKSIAVARGHSQGLPKIFRASIKLYRAHRAVIFAIAQLSC